MSLFERPCTKGSSKRTLILGVGALLLLALALGACQPAATPEPTEPPPPPTAKPTEPPPPPPTPLPDQSAFLAAWESGPHAHNYDLGKGPNTYCSRCHSPQNWDPASRPDRPPNCITCKFPTDEEVRMATTMDFVEEEDWVSITCVTCHQVDENGIVLPGNAWLNVVTGEHEMVNTPNEICAKCHANTSGIEVSGGTGVTHAVTLGGSAHLNWAGEWPQANRPQYCSDCHDPHSTVPKQCEDCHAKVLTSDTHMKGYNAIMLPKVTCMACHDAADYDVGPHPDEEMGGIWVTQETTMGRRGPSTSVIVSHSIQWQVACDRCHSKGNVHGLSARDSDGNPAEETICVEGETLTVLYDDLGTYGVVDEDFTMGECPTEE